MDPRKRRLKQAATIHTLLMTMATAAPEGLCRATGALRSRAGGGWHSPSIKEGLLLPRQVRRGLAEPVPWGEAGAHRTAADSPWIT